MAINYNENKIAKLKKQARKYYHQYYSNSASCGFSLLEYMSAQTLQAKLKFNTTMDKLTVLDSTTPKGRL